MAPWMVSVWARGVVSWGVSMVGAVAGLWLPRGGVAQHWAGEPAGWSTSIGEAVVGGLADAVAAYKQGVAVGMTAASGEAEGGSMPMGVEENTLVYLVVGGLMVVGGGSRKGRRKLSSFLEGAAFWGAMVGCKGQPEKLGV